MDKNEYEIRLDQTRKVFETLAVLINNGESCSYRYLIYDLLGFKPDAYEDLLTGMVLTNFLVDTMKHDDNNGSIKE